MCRDKLNGGRRCKTTQRTKALDTARKQKRRIEQQMKEEDISHDRKEILRERYALALRNLQEARSMPDDGHEDD
jgi:hypothetical protein